MKAKILVLLMIAAVLCGCNTIGEYLGMTAAGATGSTELVQKQYAKKADKSAFDTRGEMAVLAKALSETAPSAVGQIPLACHGVDTLCVVPGTGVLAGMCDQTVGSSFPSYGPLVLFDEGLQRQCWSWDRPKAFENPFSIVATSPVVLTESRTADKGVSYFALEPSTGKLLWTLQRGGSDRLGLGKDVAVFSSAKSGTLRLEAVDLRTGKSVWRGVFETAPAGQEEYAPRILVRNDLVLAAYAGLSCASLKDGKILWSSPDSGPGGDEGLFQSLAGGILCGDGEGVLSLTGYDGRRIWRARLSGAFSGPAAEDEGSIYVVASGGKESDRMLRIAPKDGSVIWDKPIRGSIRSRILAAEGRVVAVSEAPGAGSRLLVGFDRRTGASWSADLGESGLSDHLVLYPGRVVVAQETGVGSFSLKDGSCAWYHQIDARRVMHYSKTVERSIALYAPEPDRDKSAPSPSEKAGREVRSTLDSIHSILTTKSWYVARAESKYSSASTLSERVETGRQLELAREIDRAGTRIAASTDMFLLTMQMANYGCEMGNALAEKLSKEEERGEYLRSLAEARLSLQIHARSVESGFFIRPVKLEDRGWGFIAVEMESGRWREVTTSPYQYYYLNGDLMNYEIPGLFGDTSLVTTGVGLDPSRWEPLIVNIITKTACPSLLRYDLSGLSLCEPGAYDRYGFIDAKGNFAFASRFDFAGVFSGGGAPVMKDGRRGRVDARGNVSWDASAPGVKPPERIIIASRPKDADEFSEGLAPVMEEGAFRYIDASGSVRIRGPFVAAEPFSEGLALVVAESGKERVRQYIDTSGRIAIPPSTLARFEGSFRDGRARASGTGKAALLHGYVDKVGKTAIPLEWDEVGDFVNGLALVRKDRSWSIIDISGKIVLGPRAKLKLYPTGLDGLSSVQIDGLWGALDEKGRIAIPARFVNEITFSEGLAAVQVDRSAPNGR